MLRSPLRRVKRSLLHHLGISRLSDSNDAVLAELQALRHLMAMQLNKSEHCVFGNTPTRFDAPAVPSAATQSEPPPSAAGHASGPPPSSVFPETVDTLVRQMETSLQEIALRIDAVPFAESGTKSPCCPICRGAECVLFEAARPQQLWICSECRHLFWERMPTAEELKRFYSEEYCDGHHQQTIQAELRQYYRSHIEEIRQWLGREPRDICLVDYGSSIPVLAEEAKTAGIGKPIAVDYDERSFEYARSRGLEIMTPDEFPQRIPDESVDAIRFSHVLEHLIDPRAVIETAARKLRSGGLLYITQPNLPVFKARKTNYQIKDSTYPTHLHFFSPLSLLRLLDGLPLRAEKLFTVARHDEVYRETAHLIDFDYARERLADVADRGEPARGERANFPYFSGENSSLYARKAA